MLPGDFSTSYYTIGNTGDAVDQERAGFSQSTDPAVPDLPPPSPPSEPVYNPYAQADGFESALRDEAVATVPTDDIGDYPYNEAPNIPQSPGDVRISGWVSVNPPPVSVPVSSFAPPPPPPPPSYEIDPGPEVFDLNALGVSMFGGAWKGTPEQVAMLPRPGASVSPVTSKITPTEAVVTLRPVFMEPTPNLLGGPKSELGTKLAVGVRRVGRPEDAPESRVNPLAVVAVAAALVLAVFLSKG